ncbi:MAG: DNA mismatch repair protein MutS [Alphaproteobacteria bacterium]|nr:DNA mismatch repair protein MutS [Alphaproteobacteria bacterium]
MSAKNSKNPSKTSAPTPMFAQYARIKAEHPDCLLFFRMGDFYEMFFEDAKAAARALDIALTQRGTHEGKPVPMAGVPVHSAEQYLPRLIRAGFRVAVCEQTEDPAEAKKRGPKSVVNRAVVRIITSGTLTEEGLLAARRNNYLAAIAEAGGELALAWADISTGETYWQAIDGAAPIGLMSALARIDPGELLVPEALHERAALAALWQDHKDVAHPVPDSRFDSQNAAKRLCDVFQVGDVASLIDRAGEAPTRAEVAALGAIVDYVALTQIGRLPHLDRPVRIVAGDAENAGVMEIDAATRRNLELTRTADGEGHGSLLATIDRTITSAGARALAQRLGAPLTDIATIDRRLDWVTYYAQAISGGGDLTTRIAATLRATPDVERALTRLDLGRGGPRDLAAIRDTARAGESLRAAHEQTATLGGLPSPKRSFSFAQAGEPADLTAALERLGGNDALIARLDAALAADLPLQARDGGFIAPGYSAELDAQRQLRDDARKHIAGLQARYAELAGVTGLKIKHNNVLGYFIEVTATHADKLQLEDLPFIHRQTLANQVRFTTTELAELVEKITLAHDRALAIELGEKIELARSVAAARDRVAGTGKAIAEIDVARALADLAVAQNYCRPELNQGLGFHIVQGRHPVVEQALRETGADAFIANDCRMEESDKQASRIWLLTGPNMAGKSTFLRQNALIIALAQMGAYVPARSAVIGVADRIFSRVGAADDLARGRSTFMVEMVETATILSAASPRSFVILDEIGRGTATYDGLSIAWAAMEYLHDTNGCRTIFATHFHELTSLAERLDHLSCHTMAVKEWRGNVVFLHEVMAGAADRSYGIHVAELAGLPGAVLARAREILARLEASEQSHTLRSLVSDLPLFQADAGPHSDPGSAVDQALADLKIDEMSPREALDTLYRLRELLDD